MLSREIGFANQKFIDERNRKKELGKRRKKIKEQNQERRVAKKKRKESLQK